MKQLLLGCGHSRVKRLTGFHNPSLDWDDLVTLDNNADCKPDLWCDLNHYAWAVKPLTTRGEDACRWSNVLCKLKPNYFDEVHAYEVLEHLGRQGDAGSFFHTFDNIYRCLVPDGLLLGTVPSRYSPWLWGDPSHTRAILPESLIFLSQENYKNQLGKTAMSDYRGMWRGDFKTLSSSDDKETHTFILQAIKPARL